MKNRTTHSRISPSSLDYGSAVGFIGAAQKVWLTVSAPSKSMLLDDYYILHIPAEIEHT